MKKILIPIEANKELPKTSNNYPTFVGISFTELYFNAVDKTWYCPLTPEDVPTNNEVIFIWYKEITGDEYPFRGFWKRLYDFVSNVEVADPMGEEEKDMILHICKERIEQ